MWSGPPHAHAHHTHREAVSITQPLQEIAHTVDELETAILDVVQTEKQITFRLDSARNRLLKVPPPLAPAPSTYPRPSLFSPLAARQVEVAATAVSAAAGIGAVVTGIFGMNLQSPLFHDPKFRSPLAHASSRRALHGRLLLTRHHMHANRTLAMNAPTPPAPRPAPPSPTRTTTPRSDGATFNGTASAVIVGCVLVSISMVTFLYCSTRLVTRMCGDAPRNRCPTQPTPQATVSSSLTRSRRAFVPCDSERRDAVARSVQKLCCVCDAANSTDGDETHTGRPSGKTSGKTEDRALLVEMHGMGCRHVDLKAGCSSCRLMPPGHPYRASSDTPNQGEAPVEREAN